MPYVNGEIEGELIEYYHGGIIKSKRNYKNGHLNGTSCWYYLSGNLKTKSNHFYGSYHGEHLEYWENGALKEKSNYYQNSLSGYYFSYHENGKPHTNCYYSGNLIDGLFYSYYDNGQLEFCLKYDKGNISQNGDTKIYYKNGNLKEITEYKNGKRTGNWKLYTESGTIKEEARCKNGIKGTKLEYYPNGDLKSIISFLKNQPSYYYRYNTVEFLNHGVKLIFDENENLEYREDYYYGQLLRVIFSNGKNKDKWHYVYNKQNQYNNDSTNKYPSVNGTFSNNNFKLESIVNISKQTILKNGKTNYFGLYSFVNDISSAISDSVYEIPHPLNEDDFYNKGIFKHEWGLFEKLISLTLFSENSHEWLPELVYAKGKITEGLKEGEWIEGFFFNPYEQKRKKHDSESDIFSYTKSDIDLESPYCTYASGHYINNKKEGIWKFITANFIIEGKYNNDKKEGIWKCTTKKISEKNKNYFIDADGNYDTLPNSIILVGNYKNGLPDDIWTIYNKQNHSISEELMFSNGKLIGSILKNYSIGTLSLKGVKTSDSMVYTYYSPLGDKLNKKNWEEKTYYTITNGNKNGKYYSWDYFGNITQKGFFTNNISDKEWIDLAIKDTLALMYYNHGKLNGEYFTKYNNNYIKGMYVDGVKTGKWIDSTYNYKRLENYIDGKCYLIDYKENNIQLITEGFGKITQKENFYHNRDPYYAPVKELFYKNGLVFRTKEFYQNHVLKSDTYVTPKGDSLAIYNSPFGGLCVNSGEGNVTSYDEQNRVISIKFYEDGKLQKEEFYDKGIYRYTKSNFMSKYESKPIIYRKISRISSNEYLVEIHLSNLVNIAPFQKLIEFVPPQFLVKAKPQNDVTVSINNSTIGFIWSKNYNTETIVSYSIIVKPNEKLDPNYLGEFNLVRNNIGSKVFIEKQNIEFNP